MKRVVDNWWLDIYVSGAPAPVDRRGPYRSEAEAYKARERLQEQVKRSGWMHRITLPLKRTQIVRSR